jgi:ribonuclease VapC
MIAIDSSAIIAILNDEPERRAFNEAIERSDGCLMSTASFIETAIVIDNQRGYDGLRDFDLFIMSAGIELVPVDADQAHIARQAFRQYGKGRHRAALNFGDCFSYALAKATGLPLLFKGTDFAQTDLQIAVT